MRPLVLSAILVFLAGCGDRQPEDQVLNIYAASSLADVFQELERDFEAEHPGINAVLTFAGSQVLRLQIEQGARADVFVSANPDHMHALVAAGFIETSPVLTRNELTLIVPLSNPAEVESFADLPQVERLVIGTENVPVGRYTREALDRAGERFGANFKKEVMERVVSEESNVRLARAKVEFGEADAAIVYRSDAVSSGQVRSVSIPAELNSNADYLIGMLVDTQASDLAEDWINYVRSASSQRVFDRYGFVSR